MWAPHPVPRHRIQPSAYAGALYFAWEESDFQFRHTPSIPTANPQLPIGCLPHVRSGSPSRARRTQLEPFGIDVCIGPIACSRVSSVPAGGAIVFGMSHSQKWHREANRRCGFAFSSSLLLRSSLLLAFSLFLAFAFLYFRLA